MIFDVFISYANQDKATADAACAQLEAEGIRCWIAPRDVPPGAEWAGAIVDAIDDCRAMVLIFSSGTNESKQIRREVQQAFDGEKPVVPFRIENVAPEKSLRYYMGSVHWLDALTLPLEQHFQKLAESVKPFARSKPSGEQENEERVLREAETRRRAEEEQRRQEEEHQRKTAVEVEQQRLEGEAAATREAEEQGRQAAAAEAERLRQERDAAATHEAEEKARQEERRKKEEDERGWEEAEAKRRSEQARAFAAVKRDDSVLAVDKFLDTYPESNLAGEARALRAMLLARGEAHKNAMASEDPAVLKAFLKTYPKGTQADEVRRRLRRLELPSSRRPLLIAGVLGVGMVIAIGVWVAVRPPPPIVVTVLSPEQERARKPKDTFKECDKCPEMIVVPAGTFTMGSPANELDHGADEGPQHRVTIAKPFAVGRFELTFDEWDACVANGGCNGHWFRDAGWGRGRRPVIDVSWDDAKAYVAWLSRETGKPYRLFSEAEFEYAARAGSQTAYPWGNDIGKGNADCDGCGSEWDGKQAAPVGSFAANAFGLYDMAGNVQEWVEDCYHDNYGGAPTDGSAWTSGDCSRRVLRGGTWRSVPQSFRSADRGSCPPGCWGDGVGFRVGRTLITP